MTIHPVVLYESHLHIYENARTFKKMRENHVKAINQSEGCDGWLFDIPYTPRAFSNACHIVKWDPLNAKKGCL